MLIVKDLNQYYSGSHILRNVNFEVPKGQLTSLLGRNGVGKTTLLNGMINAITKRPSDAKFINLETVPESEIGVDYFKPLYLCNRPT